MKSESLVIADQHAAVNTFSGLVLTNKCARQRIVLSGLNPLLSYRLGERSRKVGPTPRGMD